MKARQVSIRTTEFASMLLVKLLAILASITLLAMPHLARKLVERFSPSNFAAAVIAQNKDAFDRLGEM